MDTSLLSSKYCRSTDFQGILTLLANSIGVAKLLNRHFGSKAGAEAIKMLRSGTLTGEIGYKTEEFLEEVIATKSNKVWGGTIYDPNDVENLDRQFPVEVFGYEGVFFVRSLESDDIGYFTAEKDALSYIRMNWTDVLNG